MKFITVFLISTFTLSLGYGQVQAQDNSLSKKPKHQIGFIVGLGSQGFGINVDYQYTVTYFKAQYNRLLLTRNSWDLDLIIQPQYNLTKLRGCNRNSELLNGFEFGINAGVLIRKNITPDVFNIYASISLGPHYISKTIERQSKGFLLSDNFFLGANIRVMPRTFLDLRFGYRHLSNANIKQPNGGINNFIVSGGFLVDLLIKEQ